MDAKKDSIIFSAKSLATQVKKTVIIVAGGCGQRMGTDIPKQFLLVCGMPVLMHTLERFYSYDPQLRILLVLPDNYRQVWEELCEEYFFSVPHEVVSGGAQRFHSVKAALALCEENSLIAIHDGVRPLVSVQTITSSFDLALQTGSAVPVISPDESIRIIQNGSSQSIHRNNVKLVQTPQVFRSDILQQAYQTDYQEQFTDDASVVEHAGFQVHLCEGNPENIKITHAIDLELAGLFLNAV